MPIIANLIAWIVRVVGSWVTKPLLDLFIYIGQFLFLNVIQVLTELVKTQLQKLKKKKENKEEVKKSMQPLEKAKTEEEINAAADNALDSF